MDTIYLVIITVVMLIISAIATGTVISIKFTKKGDPDDDLNLNTLSAESLLEVVAGTPLSELFGEGDNVEIVIKTNGHPVAGKEYAATKLCGHVKLTNGTEPNFTPSAHIV
ncbi:hypothetical protein [Psychrobacter sp. W2-37-MNA-CIBAN-0211]|uniref:hypothetical protein n=1 Tax=Psychrobacter sp. W2-37-MNA-CIBAN-0211 TaxID=3140443 RepID=UPI00332573E5